MFTTFYITLFAVCTSLQPDEYRIVVQSSLFSFDFIIITKNKNRPRLKTVLPIDKTKDAKWIAQNNSWVCRISLLKSRLGGPCRQNPPAKNESDWKNKRFAHLQSPGWSMYAALSTCSSLREPFISAQSFRPWPRNCIEHTA